MEFMTVWKSPNAPVSVLTADDLIEREDLRAFRLNLERLSRETSGWLIVDFTSTRHVYYRLADVLSRTEEEMRRRKGHLALTGTNRYLEQIFAVTGGTGEIPRFSTFEDALMAAGA